MKGLVGFVFWATVICLVAYLGIQYIFVDVPGPSPTFDCDDSTLYMYNHFTELGCEVQVIAGNLDMTGESFEETDHVWLLVRVGDGWQAYDWGYPCFDDQHYEGYAVSYEQLLEVSRRDNEKG